MKIKLLVLLIPFLTACSNGRYIGPKLSATVGLFGATFGVSLGSDPAAMAGVAAASTLVMPSTKSLAK